MRCFSLLHSLWVKVRLERWASWREPRRKGGHAPSEHGQHSTWVGVTLSRLNIHSAHFQRPHKTCSHRVILTYKSTLTWHKTAPPTPHKPSFSSVSSQIDGWRVPEVWSPFALLSVYECSGSGINFPPKALASISQSAVSHN